MIPALPCARRLQVDGMGKCPSDVKRFRFTCLSCRLRRVWLGNYTVPNYIKYTYTSFRYVSPLPNGKVLIQYPYVLIDPRGHFTMARCAGIIVLDKIIKFARRFNKNYRLQCKPWVEFAEFLANYPVW